MRRKGGFSLGVGLLMLLERASGQYNLMQLSRPFMEKLAGSLGESICLGSVSGISIKIEECVMGEGEMRLLLKPGMVLPAFAGATAKVLFASLPASEARSILQKESLPHFTDTSILDPEKFLEEVRRASSLGYAVDNEEYLRGVRAVAAPVTRNGELIAVLWVVGHTLTLNSEALQAAAEEIVEAAKSISLLASRRNKVLVSGAS
jgi:IclR family KDG regulon transcriptional repressor